MYVDLHSPKPYRKSLEITVLRTSFHKNIWKFLGFSHRFLTLTNSHTRPSPPHTRHTHCHLHGLYSLQVLRELWTTGLHKLEAKPQISRDGKFQKAPDFTGVFVSTKLWGYLLKKIYVKYWELLTTPKIGISCHKYGIQTWVWPKICQTQNKSVFHCKVYIVPIWAHNPWLGPPRKINWFCSPHLTIVISYVISKKSNLANYGAPKAVEVHASMDCFEGKSTRPPDCSSTRKIRLGICRIFHRSVVMRIFRCQSIHQKKSYAQLYEKLDKIGIY